MDMVLSVENAEKYYGREPNLKKALELFPGFKSEIQYLLEELAEAEAASPQEEIAALEL